MSHVALPSVLAGLTSLLAAQGAADLDVPTDRTALPPAAVPIHTQAPDDGVDYGLWAAGTTYKMSFHDGAVVVPYLGRDYPTNQSLRWRTLSATLGERELRTRAVPQLSHEEWRAEYDHGGIVEAWELLPDGVEQTFVITRRPAAGGDLVIRGETLGPLTARARPAAHAPVDFLDAADNPILRYGSATAVDATGRRSPMTTAVTGNVLTLRLNGAWLAAAEFPVVVDPLLGVVYSIAGGAPLESLDLERISGISLGEIWHVTERYASAADADISLRRVDDDGSSDWLCFADVTSLWSTTDPSLGQHRPAQKVVLAFARYFPTSDTRKLRYHLHDFADFTQTGTARAIDTGSAQGWRPVVGSSRNLNAGPHVLVVYQQEGGLTWYETTQSEIFGAALDVTGAGTAGTPFPIDAGPLEDRARPTINFENEGNDEWTVAWQIIGNPLFSPHVRSDILVARVDRHGGVRGETGFGVGNDRHELTPRLAGSASHAVLAWVHGTTAQLGSNPSGPNGNGAFARRLLWDGTAFSLQGGWSHLEPDPRLVLTGIDIDRRTSSHAAIMFRSTVTQNVYLRTVGYTGSLLASATVYAAANNETTISGAVAFDDLHDRFLLGYCRNLGVNNRTYVDRYAHPHEPAISTSGLGCSAATLSWSGSQLIGDEGCAIRLYNLPQGALATVIVGLAPFSQLITGVPAVHPGCWLNVPNTGPLHLATLPVRFGPSTLWQIDLPEFLDPMTLWFQGVHFDAAGTEVFTTDRLGVPIVK